MAGVIVLALAVVPLAVVGLALRLPRSPGSFDDPLGEAASTARWRVIGTAVGVTTSGLLLFWDPVGRGPMLAAPAFSLSLLMGILLGESRISAPAGRTRTASLEVRRLTNYLPRRLTSWVAIALGYLVLLLAITTVIGSSDDVGRAGRALVLTCGSDLTQSRGPWPGSFYSIPLLVAVLGGLVAAGMALRGIVQRPREGVDQADDDQRRARSVHDVIAGLGVLIAVPLAGVTTLSAMALSGLSCRPPAWTALFAVVSLSIPLVCGLVLWCVGALLAPRAALGADREALLK